MLVARYKPYILHFNFTAITSRASMIEKETYFIEIFDTDDETKKGIGEVAIFRGLSSDDTPDFESKLSEICHQINDVKVSEIDSSAIRFGVETALADLKSGATMRPFNISDEWSIPINGLIWMGDKPTMLSRIKEKLTAGYRCLKLKIGGIDFEREVEILKSIRGEFSANDLEIRLDANGSFSAENAITRLNILSKFDIHSLEQPIAPRQWDAMRDICRKSPIDIALDEELIGITDDASKAELIRYLKPRYLILKPSLCGGFSEADKWIIAAEAADVGWWATSALESNIGLNAIARWLSTKAISMPQGLGTGLLYSNNIQSPLVLTDCSLKTDSSKTWKTDLIF